MWKYGPEGFFLLTYVESKHQSNEHNEAGAKAFSTLDLDILSMSAISCVV